MSTTTTTTPTASTNGAPATIATFFATNDVCVAEVLGQELVATDRGDPQLRLKIKLLEKLKNGWDLADGTIPLPPGVQVVREISMQLAGLSERALTFIKDSLVSYGWDRQISSLANDAPKARRFGLEGTRICVKVKLVDSTKNPGSKIDYWDVVPTSRGDNRPPRKAFSFEAAQELDAALREQELQSSASEHAGSDDIPF